jgi:hypothetical protein
MYYDMEIDKPFGILGNQSAESALVPAQCLDLDYETFPDLKSYYSYILYNTSRIFPSTKPDLGKPNQQLMIEWPELQKLNPFKSSCRSHTMDYQYNYIYKRKCLGTYLPTKYVKF